MYGIFRGIYFRDLRLTMKISENKNPAKITRYTILPRDVRHLRELKLNVIFMDLNISR